MTSTGKSRAGTSGRGATSRRYFYRGEALRDPWDDLHRCDREPWPDAQWIASLVHGQRPAASELKTLGGALPVAAQLQEAWRAFHAGEYAHAIGRGAKLGPFGAVVASKAAAVQSLSAGKGGAGRAERRSAGCRSRDRGPAGCAGRGGGGDV